MTSLLEELRRSLAPQYEIEKELAAGGMGAVFLARDVALDRRVAVKTIRPDIATDAFTQRLRREARTLAKLNHPNIVPVHAAGDADGHFYYIMDYVDGDTLKERLSRGTMSVEEGRSLGAGLLDALAAAHDRGIVHRDVKPGNVFLVGDRVLLGDFGIAKHVEDATRDITAPGQQLGTPGYMPPEQAAGEATARTDIYATGMVLYEALTGRRWQVLKSTGETDWSGIPAEMAPALRRALAWSPEARWPSASAFRQALLSEATPAAARAPGGLKSLLGRFRRGRDAAPTGASPIQLGMPVESIAVMPFADMSAEHDQEYFSDGMTEELIDALAKIEGLRVAARTSSFQFKGRATDVRDVGRKLGVQTVLEGSVRKAGERLRITTQLIDVHDGFHIWSEKYNRQLADVFSVQEEIARSIVDALAIRLPGGPTKTLVRKPTDDLEAHNLYLRGRYLWNKRTKEGLENAVEFFEQAIERDPDYALAYAGLADAYHIMATYRYRPKADALRRAKEAAERAIELDDSLAEAHTARGLALRPQLKQKEEEREYLRAIAINPNYAQAHSCYSTLLAALGRLDEALREARTAEQLDPLSVAISNTVGTVLHLSRDPDAAIDQGKKTLELDTNFVPALRLLGATYILKGMHEEATRTIERAIELAPHNPDLISLLAIAHATAGKTEKALELVAQAEERGGDSGWIAAAYGSLGKTDQAFEYLAASFKSPETRRELAFFAKVVPLFEPLRSDPRFDQLLREAGLD